MLRGGKCQMFSGSLGFVLLIALWSTSGHAVDSPDRPVADDLSRQHAAQSAKDQAGRDGRLQAAGPSREPVIIQVGSLRLVGVSGCLVWEVVGHVVPETR